MPPSDSQKVWIFWLAVMFLAVFGRDELFHHLNQQVVIILSGMQLMIMIITIMIIIIVSIMINMMITIIIIVMINTMIIMTINKKLWLFWPACHSWSWSWWSKSLSASWSTWWWSRKSCDYFGRRATRVGRPGSIKAGKVTTLWKHLHHKHFFCVVFFRSFCRSFF